MDYFGINSAEDLPKIKEVLADQMVEPTVMKDVIANEKAELTSEEIDTNEALAVTEEGELIANNSNPDEEQS